MKIFDCTLYYDENLILETRLNILDKYVDKFVICESTFTHSGKEKKLNFNIKKFSKFKSKIIYLVNDTEPKNIIYDKNFKEPSDQMRPNAMKRIANQREFLLKGLESADDNDLILYSDNDEIPNPETLNENLLKEKISIFEQKLFYYKFNLLYDKLLWYGTRACRKKHLPKFEILRLIKPKKYPLFRIDTFFKKNKRMDVQIIKNGGWHFTRVISPEEIHKKELIAEHHDEYKMSGKDPQKIADLIKRRVIDHNHFVDSTKSKYGKEFKLKQLSVNELPNYISQNIDKFRKFLDLD
ncbi:MAG: hypothetical protein CBE07_001890 [Pelagibacteraceae bacterium TMED247]|nr:hypothetical protein [Candidatus Pelagibacter sp.]RPG05578.1 MAG: hypothetical protein CBE07_001890 [Pelagibacteraceae bacterium TMED247]|tara:strand:- start:1566 stop:2453 length:888 start_codon:yes stop_codon:yes gene_type:complete